MEFEQKLGLLAPIFSLPGRHGIGDLGTESFAFADLMHRHKLRLWQILPLNPVGYGYSPYQPFSSFAGDPIYISLDSLKEMGLIKENIPDFKAKSRKVDYEGVRKFKDVWIERAFMNFDESDKSYQAFLKDAFWLEDFALFMALKKRYALAGWTEWNETDQNKNTVEWTDELRQAVKRIYFEQYIFMSQWQALKHYAHALQIDIMGDIPFYVGLDSADVWANPQYFEMNGIHPTQIAGVPPDYFSKTGQRWGNPIYHWKKLKEEGYRFWIERLAWNHRLYDILRLDHFRAIDSYWSVNPECETAEDGQWILGPSSDLMDAIDHAIPDIYLVAEDLGDLRPETHELRDKYALKGMEILHFSMPWPGINRRLEEERNVIVYTGTHDNHTTKGWYRQLKRKEKKQVNAHLKRKGLYTGTLVERVIRFAMMCKAEFIVIPIYDFLEIGDRARLNVPSTINDKNWRWRTVQLKKLDQKLKNYHHQSLNQ